MSKVYQQKPVARKFHLITCTSCFKEARVGIHRHCLCDACFSERQTDYRVSFNEEEEKRLNQYLKENGLNSKLY